MRSSRHAATAALEELQSAQERKTYLDAQSQDLTEAMQTLAMAGGSMAHSLVPPTPGPLFAAGAFGVSIGFMIVMGTVVVVAVFVLLFNLVVDILYGVVDPRVRLS